MKFLKQNLGEFIIGTSVFIFVFLLSQIRFLSGVADSFDFSLFSYQKTPASDEIIIVALDNATINNPQFKRYQDISRNDYVKVIDNILKGNPKAVGLDVFLFNPAEDIQSDEQLAKLFREHRNLITVNEYDYDTNQFIEPAETLHISKDQRGTASKTSSSFNNNIIINQTPFIFLKDRVQEANHEPFTVKIFRSLKIGRQSAYFDEKNSIYKIIRGNEETNVPINNLIANINFYGPPNSFEHISYFDVWNDNINPEVFNDKIVLIGATAHDIHDEFLTPTSKLNYMAGVEIHANFLQTLLNEDYIYYLSFNKTLLVIIAVIVFLLVFYAFFGFITRSLFTLLILGGFYGFAVYLFVYQNLIISIFWPILAGISFWSIVHIYRFLKSEKQRIAIRNTFSRYVAVDIVNEILKNPKGINLGGEMREITTFFSDLEGFTSISEKLSTAEIMQLLNDYLDKMSSIILTEKGTIDKYMGDAIMAFWGAPINCPNQATKACNTALFQQKAIPEINQKLKERNLPNVAVRIGINTGMANVGNIGTSERLEYTAIGDTVNLGSRLESINKQYGTKIIISESTKEKLEADRFFLRELDLICVKGKTKPIRIFELIAFNGEQTKEQENIKKTYEEGLEFYRKQDWKKAEAKFASLKNDIVSKKMLERIEILKNENLGKNWNGAYTFVTK